MVALSPGPSWTDTYDFSTFESNEENNTTRKTDFTDKRLELWNGAGRNIKRFETVLIGDRLVWAYVMNRSIHFRSGKRPDFGTGSIQEKIPGLILNFDLYSLDHSQGNALLTVTYRSNKSLYTAIYSLNQTGNSLRLKKFKTLESTALRPLDQFMYGQTYGPATFWATSIYEYRTTSTGYQQGQPLNLPVNSKRIFSLTSLGSDRWIAINGKGNLVLTARGRKFNQVEGDFGITTDSLNTDRAASRRPEKSEPIRLSPAYLPEKNIVAVPKNPRNESGLQGFLFGGGSSSASSIVLFRINQSTISKIGSIGPMSGRIRDLEVPTANPNQLLWLRTSTDDRSILEMVDFSSLSS